MKDLDCWSERNSISAEGACEKKIEWAAEYEFRWMEKLGQRFSHVAWVDEEKGQYRLVGNRIQFNNKYNAWKQHGYSCTYDPSAEKVLRLIISDAVERADTP